MRIEELRAEIDDIDEALVRLLNRRAGTAIEVGMLKRTAELPLCDVDRERDVLTKVCHANAGPLDDEAVTRLFRRIIRESRRVEARVVEYSSSMSSKPEQEIHAFQTRTGQESRRTFDPLREE